MPDSETTRASFIGPQKGLPSGLPGIWITALATLAVLLMLAALLWIVGVNAFGWFWPARISEVVLDDGTVRVGEITAREPIPSAAKEAVDILFRLQLKTGNRELTRADFLWVDEAAIVERSQPVDLVRVVRSEYGDAFGRVVGAVLDDGTAVDMGSAQALEGLLQTGEDWRRERRRLEEERERLRRPLTRLEERLDLLERSAHSKTSEGEQEIATLARAVAQEGKRLAPRLDALQHDLEDYGSRLTRSRIILESGADHIEVPLSNMVQLVWANKMGLPSRVIHAVREGVLFLFTEPREANTEGGIFPALFGTVLLVLLMSVAVVPLGVVTAVYMTEYARPGLPLRLANQAVNNLAGVPSIVFGMFGLAFFVYEVGGVDGPGPFCGQAADADLWHRRRPVGLVDPGPLDGAGRRGRDPGRSVWRCLRAGATDRWPSVRRDGRPCGGSFFQRPCRAS